MQICDRKHLNSWVIRAANTFTTLAIILSSLITIINGADNEVPLELSAGSHGIIAAFADVNSDRLTDILMISKDQKSFYILLTNTENTDIISDKILNKNFTCALSPSLKESIVNLIPGDFDGDSRIDIAVITNASKEFRVRFVSGFRPDCTSLDEKPTISSVIEPFMLDFNGDMICDLLTQDKDGKRSVHIAKKYSPNEGRISFEEIHPFGEAGKGKILNPHSCTIVDINADNLPDLIIPTEHNIEYWFGHKNGTYPGKFHENADEMIGYPLNWRGENDFNVKIGQSIFMDVDGDGKIEHLIPVVNHDVSSIWELRNHSNHFDWIPIVSNLSNVNVSCNFEKRDFGSLTLPITLRQGDIDNDGYPDLLATVVDNDGKRFLALLRNQVNATDSSKRTFVAENLLPKVKDPIIGAFFDITENGKMDVLVSAKTEDNTSTKLILMENKEALEANFLKMMVASKNCPKEDCIAGSWFTLRDIVNYGSNIPGAQINYQMPDLNGKIRLGTAGQLKQSSHLALETPYILFGLGKMANYIETIKVTLPSEENKTVKKRTLAMDQGYFPDAYIIVVPRSEDPNKWLTKLFVTKNVRIMNTGYALLGTCALLIVVIVFLHRKELREDAPEVKQFRQNWLDRR